MLKPVAAVLTLQCHEIIPPESSHPFFPLHLSIRHMILHLQQVIFEFATDFHDVGKVLILDLLLFVLGQLPCRSDDVSDLSAVQITTSQRC